MATKAALRTVPRAQWCLAKGGAVGWSCWNVKEGFQNVREMDVVREMEKLEKAKKWIP